MGNNDLEMGSYEGGICGGENCLRASTFKGASQWEAGEPQNPEDVSGVHFMI